MVNATETSQQLNFDVDFYLRHVIFIFIHHPDSRGIHNITDPFRTTGGWLCSHKDKGDILPWSCNRITQSL